MTITRQDKILELIDKAGIGLEIGPSYSPIAPKKDGWNVKIADHTDAESLKRKYAAWGVDIGAIEEVDYVIEKEGLSTTVGKKSYFDFILASHVIEHMPDVIKFLIECEGLLKVNGILSLVIPDKRYCFDAIKPCSTTGQFLQAYSDQRTRHSLGTIFDAHALHVTNDNAIVWPRGQAINDLKFMHTLTEAKNIMDEYSKHNNFVDVHAWQFTPASFAMLIFDLTEMELINLEVATRYDTESHEFFVSLRKASSITKGSDEKRSTLAQAIREEATTWTNGNTINSEYQIPIALTNPNHLFSHVGRCPICERLTTFVSENTWFRDYLLCSGCLSVPRERAVMRLISEIKPDWRNLIIHESSPANRGTSAKLKSSCINYIASQYYPNSELGTVHSDQLYRNEDLGNQTFPDESFDLVITQDVFEHLPDPAAAIKEIARTLKPGGLHIASIPLVRKWEPSLTRARILTNGQIEHLSPAEFHGNPVDNQGSLVMTDWGYDIASFFQGHSEMDTVIYNINDIDHGIRAEYIEIVVSKKLLIS
jgi:2-polyprenyl-3-methyl-5-hydroxy-6-metoxy-1,4-benzoquinol methylase